jgi:hypothetical protein
MQAPGNSREEVIMKLKFWLSSALFVSAVLCLAASAPALAKGPHLAVTEAPESKAIPARPSGGYDTELPQWEYDTVQVELAEGITLGQSEDYLSPQCEEDGSVCFLENANLPVSEKLTKLGVEGWELVSVLPEGESTMTLVFKRIAPQLTYYYQAYQDPDTDAYLLCMTAPQTEEHFSVTPGEEPVSRSSCDAEEIDGYILIPQSEVFTHLGELSALTFGVLPEQGYKISQQKFAVAHPYFGE